MASRIQLKRTTVAGRIPTIDQLVDGELAINVNDGKLFLRQDQPVGVGTRIISVNGVEPGNTYFVTVNGNDDDNGLSEDRAFLTIKKAAEVADRGDSIIVSAGTYVEDNPIVLKDFVTIIGGDIRNCNISPLNPEQDLIHLGQGGTVQDLSFVGYANTGSAVIAYRPLSGVSSDRFFDAARLIRQNLNFIAAETVGYITSTDYSNPPINVPDTDRCAEDVKAVYRAVCHDITRGGNSKCIGAGKSYFDENENLIHIVGVGTATIDALTYSIGIARSCINNLEWQSNNYQEEYYQTRDLSIQDDPETLSNQDFGSCANVHSAVTVCVGIVTNIIKNGLNGDYPTLGFTTNYPGNNGTINSGILTASLSPSQGVGVIRKGPYIRNCTNFIRNSIGAKIDGFNSDEGDQINEIGVQGSFNVDAFTQFNQGGIGVSVTNGAYCQLVSIFTICNDTAIYAGNGGQLDLTNSNSSFGTRGLVSDGVGNNQSKCSDRYSGTISTFTGINNTTIEVSGIGSNRPYNGQAVYFGKLYSTIREIVVTDGGSNYSTTPRVIIDNPTGIGNSIAAQATATIQNGRVISINLLNSGLQYETVPSITFEGGGGSGASAVAIMDPIYYGVDSSTEPSAGISTITLVQSLNNDVGIGTTVYFSRQSLQIASSHSFQYIGAGNTIELAYPSRGGVSIQENEVIELNGGDVTYTSTDERGNFRIGDGVVINQATGTISGRTYIKSLFTQVTPFILALGD
jgi:hypothetical protein